MVHLGDAFPEHHQQAEVGRVTVEVINTPDLFSAKDTETEPGCGERGHCYLLSSPGPHALLLVTQLGRCTAQDQQAVRRLRDMIGDGMTACTIVLFTQKEDLAGDSLQDHVCCFDNRVLQELVAECGRCACAFDNRATGWEREAQVAELMALVEQVVGAHRGAPYTNDVYRLAQALGSMHPKEWLRRVAETMVTHLQRQWGHGLLAMLWEWRRAPWSQARLGVAAMLGALDLLYLLPSRHWQDALGDVNPD
ncbi:PREDICTED: GTPase IMAP family member 1-like [Ceratotherium simum simum]|uniref:GTPase IMAP family member 1-like n=1 Tax=Ceratotherium simum simum TaxID=73337 RepID=A0ABM0HNR0_CERSS|nr:PREDICTED: GTPase IMAP family member 1-like [Ceratotherium simum simum]